MWWRRHTLEANTGNITLGLALATETGEENLVVLINEVQATIVGDESGDLLAVLDELDTDTLSDSLHHHHSQSVCSSGVRESVSIDAVYSGKTYRVGLLGLNADLFKDNALSVGRTTEGAVIPPLLAFGVREIGSVDFIRDSLLTWT